MNPIKLSALFLTGVMLTACGGGGSPTGTNNTTGGGDGGTTTTGDGTTTSTSTTVGEAAIGTGTGSSFQQNTINIENGGLTDGQLAAGGEVNVSVDVVDIQNDSARIQGAEYGVIFSSTCAGTTPAQAVFDTPEIVVNSGTATTTYRAQGCSGTDILTATLYNSNDGTIDTSSALGVASASITVVAPVVNDISYVSATENLLGIQGVGNPDLPQTTSVVFRVTDKNGDPISNQEVDFRLSIADSSVTLSKDSAKTSPAGEVQVIVNAGSVHTAVRVIASTDYQDENGTDQTTYTLSEVISVTTGYPLQSKMELVSPIFNPHAWDVSGNIVELTVFLADRFGNPPPDGTQVNFLTEGGSLVQSSCITASGACSVEWRGQERRPGNTGNNANDDYPNDRVGFSTVVAYTVGESDFVDANHNGLFDIGESFDSFGEVFVDFDQDNVKDANEDILIDADGDGAYTAANNAIYQGSICSDAARQQNHCATNMHIRSELTLVMSGEAVRVRIYPVNTNSGAPLAENANVTSLDVGTTYALIVQDVNGNIPAAGTSVNFAAEGFEITGDDGEVATGNGKGELALAPQYVTNVEYGQIYYFTIDDEDPADNPDNPRLEITVNRVRLAPTKNSFTVVP